MGEPRPAVLAVAAPRRDGMDVEEPLRVAPRRGLRVRAARAPGVSYYVLERAIIAATRAGSASPRRSAATSRAWRRWSSTPSRSPLCVVSRWVCLRALRRRRGHVADPGPAARRDDRRARRRRGVIGQRERSRQRGPRRARPAHAVDASPRAAWTKSRGRAPSPACGRGSSAASAARAICRSVGAPPRDVAPHVVRVLRLGVGGRESSRARATRSRNPGANRSICDSIGSVTSYGRAVRARGSRPTACGRRRRARRVDDAGLHDDAERPLGVATRRRRRPRPRRPPRGAPDVHRARAADTPLRPRAPAPRGPSRPCRPRGRRGSATAPRGTAPAADRRRGPAACAARCRRGSRPRPAAPRGP